MMKIKRSFDKSLVHDRLKNESDLNNTNNSDPFLRTSDRNEGGMIWGLLLHLSFNMFEEYSKSEIEKTQRLLDIRGYRPHLNLSYKLWEDILERMVGEGLNMVVIDLGNAIKYESHPEIAVRGAWPVDRLRKELKKIRNLGIEPIPKLNFSAGHDTWLLEYSRMLSTKKYYEVCSDLIEEVTDLFDHPQLFHLGMDEENYSDSRRYNYIIVRHNQLWWGDFNFLVGEVERNGSRPWVWSDYVWHHHDIFFKNMSKSVLQSNWYYDNKFDKDIKSVAAYLDLERFNYDQIPTSSNWGGMDWNFKNKKGQENTMKTVQFCHKYIANSRLLGFLQTSWRPTTEGHREAIMDCIQQMGKAKRWYDSESKEE